MYRKFLNARSPLRLLEKGLHGGLGKGNLGLVLAGRGVGKTACLVGIALDDLLRGGHVLHVALDQSVALVRPVQPHRQRLGPCTGRIARSRLRSAHTLLRKRLR